jgi:hypothetical protein
MSELILFAATFALTFVFGFVARGGYLGAFLSTLAIGLAYLLLFDLVKVTSATDAAAYLFGGPCGIVANIALRRWVVRRIAIQSFARFADSVGAAICAGFGDALMAAMVSIATMITRLEGLLGTRDLTDWEEKFVRDVASRTLFARRAGLALDLKGGTLEKLEQIHGKHFAC